MDNSHPQRLGVESVLQALESRDSVWVLRWLRAVAWRFAVGQPVATSGRAIQALLALAGLAGQHPIKILASGWSKMPATTPSSDSDLPVMLLIANAAPLGSEMAVEALRRVMDARTQDRLAPGADVVVVCCGHAGPLGADEVPVQRGHRAADVAKALETAERRLPDNLIDEPDPQHLIDSSGAGRVVLVTGENLIEAA